jgi:hypothetical protein
VNEAKRILTEYGVDVNDPTLTLEARSREISYENGRTIWRFLCYKYPESPTIETINISLKVDEQLGIVVDFHSQSLAEKVKGYVANGVPQVLTEQQAIATSNLWFSKITPNATGDWRNETERNKYSDNGTNWWTLTKRLYVYNAPVLPIYFRCNIEPHTGKIWSWSYDQNATPVGSGQIGLTAQQAKPFAKQAFINFAGSQLLATDNLEPIAIGNPAWKKIGNSTIARLSYRFVFRLNPIEDTNTDPNSLSNGRLQQDIMMVLDAETGEILDGQPLVGSGNFAGGVLDISPRFLIVHYLDKSKVAFPVALAVASGKLTSAKAPSPQARLFSIQVKNTYAKKGKVEETEERMDTFRLAYNPVSHYVTWYLDYKKQWFGVKLSEKESAKVAEWLKKAKP